MPARDPVSSPRPVMASSPPSTSFLPTTRFLSFSQSQSQTRSQSPRQRHQELPQPTGSQPMSSSSQRLSSNLPPSSFRISTPLTTFPLLSARSTTNSGVPHSFSSTYDDIRNHTMKLSNLPLSPPRSSASSIPDSQDYFSANTKQSPSLNSFPTTPTEPRQPLSPSAAGPSRLTMQLAHIRESSRSRDASPCSDNTAIVPIEHNQHHFSKRTDQYDHSDDDDDEEDYEDIAHYRQKPPKRSPNILPPSKFLPTEASQLLTKYHQPNYDAIPSAPLPVITSHTTKSFQKRLNSVIHHSVHAAKTAASPAFLADLAYRSLASVPAVFLGLLLNVLDGVSYGMIMFPAGPIFDGFGPMGVSLFFVTTVIAQLVYSFGGSSFAGGNGSMMIEVVPFFNILATEIITIVGEDNVDAIRATTLAAFSLSAILTGTTFFIMGKFRLGALMGFFPRHILVGCIGGVGWFLIETGFEVSIGLNEEGGFQYNLETFKLFFMNTHSLSLWLPAFGLAVLLRVITHKFHHQLIFPLYFLMIPIVFYIVVAAGRLNLTELRRSGWVFDVGSSADEPWWKIYTYWKLEEVQWVALVQTMPTQLALLFFNILHPPLNVPALAVSLDQDVDTNHELVSHGYSNVLAGLLGTTPNYLVYVNSVLFYRVGGGTRLAGFLLACATIVILLIGTGPIGYLPVMVVGALIFVLGFDLVMEALWDTRHRVSRTEYITIIAIMVCMTIFDFVVGVLFGVVLACFFFVIHNSHSRAIRSLYTGDTAMSTVRRPSAHRAYLREVGKYTAIMKLQYFLFFGTITYVEEKVRNLLEVGRLAANPIQFFIIDLSMVPGVDLSASEAFVRLQRMLHGKKITLVMCGFHPDSAVGKALDSVDLFSGKNVEVFETLNEALEWTENVYLNAWIESYKQETGGERTPEATAISFPGRQKFTLSLEEGSWQNSPRRTHIKSVGGKIMKPVFQLNDQELRQSPVSINSPTEDTPTTLSQQSSRHGDSYPEPIPTLMKTFRGYDADIEPLQFLPALRYFQMTIAPAGTTMWSKGDKPDGLYVVSSGVLRATYTWDNSNSITESMVAGTLAGELSGLTGLPRNATVFVEKDAVLWKLNNEDWKRFKTEESALAHRFVELVLKVAKNDYDVLIGACSRH